MTDIPKYVVIKRSIKQRIDAKEWRPGDKLPSLKQLAEQYGTSVGTLRKVVEQLVDDDVCTTRFGSGIFVKSYSNQGFWNKYQRFQRLDGTIITAYRIELLTFEHEKAEENIAHELNIACGASVIHWIRLFYVDNLPTGLDECWLPEELFPNLKYEDIENRGKGESLYSTYEKTDGVLITAASERVRGGLLTPVQANLMHLPMGTPVIQFLRRSRMVGGHVCEFRIGTCDARRCQICIE